MSLTDGTYSWTSSGGSSNPSAFSVSYNGTAMSFQVLYLSQVPAAGLAIVATYQPVLKTFESSLADGTAYLALSVNGTEESTRTRLVAVPYALKAKESEDAIALRKELQSLGVIPISSLSTSLSSVVNSLSSTSSSVASLSVSLSTSLPTVSTTQPCTHLDSLPSSLSSSLPSLTPVDSLPSLTPADSLPSLTPADSIPFRTPIISLSTSLNTPVHSLNQILILQT